MTESTTSPQVVGANEGEHLWFLANRTTIKLRAAETGGGYGLIETLAPAAFSPPVHVHANEDETYFLLEGRMTVRVGEESRLLEAGDVAFAPRGIPHTFVIEGGEPARLLTFITPGGMEQFFADVGRPAEGPGLPPVGPPEIEALARTSAAYGMEVLGPPMSPEG